jgi:hypothetical protein
MRLTGRVTALITRPSILVCAVPLSAGGAISEEADGGGG